MRFWNQSCDVHLARHGFAATDLGSMLVSSTTTAHSRVAEASHTMGWDRENTMFVLKPSASVKGHAVGSAQLCVNAIRCCAVKKEKRKDNQGHKLSMIDRTA